VFLRNSTLLMLCASDVGPLGERLHRPQLGMHRLEWANNEGAVEYHLPHGELLRLLREHRFEVEALHELYAPPGAERHAYYDYVTPAWARKWPAEEIWVARKR
jgi:hypothetical protein